MISFLIILGYTIFGTIVGGLISLVPSLHIYNVAGVALLLWTTSHSWIPDIAVAPFFMSLVVSFAFINSIPMTFFGAADESASVTILPGSKYLMTGRGFDAAMLSGVGSLVGLLMLLILTPFFLYIFPYVHHILGPHMHWILGLVMVFMLMSEWPKGNGIGKNTLQKFLNAWSNLFAGILTFVLSAILGIIFISKSIIAPEMGFQNIMPVFIGLFAIPSIIQAYLSDHKIPEQHIPETIDLDLKTLGKATFSGSLGGLMAAYLPAVTAGIGGIIAGHATAQRGDRIFIISGGVAKVLYYVGAFLFLFIITPTTPFGISRGGLAMILKPAFTPEAGDYWLILAVILFSGFLSCLLMIEGCKWTIAFMKIVSYKTIYTFAFIIIFIIIFWMTGWPGIFVCAVSTCIGSIPVFYHCRRSNCMAVLLVPIALNMAGYGAAAAQLFGLS